MVYIYVIHITITDDLRPRELPGTVILSCIISHIILLVCILVLGLCGSNDNIILSPHQYYNNIYIIVFILILWLGGSDINIHIFAKVYFANCV